MKSLRVSFDLICLIFFPWFNIGDTLPMQQDNAQILCLNVWFLMKDRRHNKHDKSCHLCISSKGICEYFLNHFAFSNGTIFLWQLHRELSNIVLVHYLEVKVRTLSLCHLCLFFLKKFVYCETYCGYAK